MTSWLRLPPSKSAHGLERELTMRRWIMAAVIAVGTFGLAVPAHARMSTVNVTAAQCKSGGGNVYAGKCHGGTWDGKEVRG